MRPAPMPAPWLPRCPGCTSLLLLPTLQSWQFSHRLSSALRARRRPGGRQVRPPRRGASEDGMSELMNLVGAHQGPVRWLSGALAALLLVVGVAVGIGRAPQPPSTLADSSFQAQPMAARLPAARHSVVGIVRAVGPNEILVRSQRGTFFAIKWGPESHFRAGGRDIEPAAIRP